MIYSESPDRPPEPERRDEAIPPHDTPQTVRPHEGRERQSASGIPDEIVGAPPVPEFTAPTSDVEHAYEAPGLPEKDAVPPALAADPTLQERRQVVPFVAGIGRPPPSLRDCVHSLPEAVLRTLHVGRDQDDEPFLQLDGRSVVHRLRDPGTRVILAQAMIDSAQVVRPAELQGMIDEIESYARLYGQRQYVWNGVAPNDLGGVDVDHGDDEQTASRIVPGQHSVVTGGTGTLFYRSPRALRRALSKSAGDFHRLFRYLKHLRFEEQRLVAAWVLYTIAHPKIPPTVFIHLFLIGPQGSGKTQLAEFLKAIISPTSVGVQPLPRNAVDLAIAASQSHCCAFDNVRSIPLWLSDLFCLMSTSGVVTGRTLYTNAGQTVISLHCAVILTSLHALATEPDLGDRILQVNVPQLDTARRRDPADLMREFKEDLPFIMSGAFELIAAVLAQLPLVVPVDPQRVYRYSHWLAALEVVDGVPTGGYQNFYRDSLGQVMLDTLHESSLNVAVMDFMDERSERSWTGTAAELLAALNRATGRRGSSGGDWPVNEIALSRRLRASVAAFRTQGIDVSFTRGRVRSITITRAGGQRNDKVY